jgi:hypothetical protein
VGDGKVWPRYLSTTELQFRTRTGFTFLVNTSLLPSVQWVPGLRRPEREAGPLTSKFMDAWSYKILLTVAETPPLSVLKTKNNIDFLCHLLTRGPPQLITWPLSVRFSQLRRWLWSGLSYRVVWYEEFKTTSVFPDCVNPNSSWSLLLSLVHSLRGIPSFCPCTLP